VSITFLGNSWFVIHVRSHHERTVSSLLGQKGYQGFVPTVPTSRLVGQPPRKEILLYPGYVFCRAPFGFGAPIVTTPGVIKILCSAGIPVPLSENEIDQIKLLINSRLRVYPHPYLNVGQRIRMIEGPLRGLEGIVVARKGTFRIVVSIELLQRSTAVEVPRSWIDAPLSVLAELPNKAAAA
jgi:transcription antitermination factor NusG